MTFAAAFREHVQPDLKRLCRVQGLLVALERRSFAEAYEAVFADARRRGALMLPADLFAGLENWITCSILAAETEFRPSVEEYRALADRVAADIERCEAAWQMME